MVGILLALAALAGTAVAVVVHRPATLRLRRRLRAAQALIHEINVTANAHREIEPLLAAQITDRIHNHIEETHQ